MIRKMDMSDIEYVYELEKKTFGKSLEKAMLTREILYNEMAHYFILIKDGKRLGYAGMWITNPNAEVINIAVEARHRKRGYGRQLMEKLIDYSNRHHVKVLTLEVHEQNGETITFYESLGFKREAVRKKYYEDGSDALLMVKWLGDQS